MFISVISGTVIGMGAYCVGAKLKFLGQIRKDLEEEGYVFDESARCGYIERQFQKAMIPGLNIIDVYRQSRDRKKLFDEYKHELERSGKISLAKDEEKNDGNTSSYNTSDEVIKKEIISDPPRKASVASDTFIDEFLIRRMEQERRNTPYVVNDALDDRFVKLYVIDRSTHSNEESNEIERYFGVINVEFLDAMVRYGFLNPIITTHAVCCNRRDKNGDEALYLKFSDSSAPYAIQELKGQLSILTMAASGHDDYLECYIDYPRGSNNSFGPFIVSRSLYEEMFERGYVNSDVQSNLLYDQHGNEIHYMFNEGTDPKIIIDFMQQLDFWSNASPKVRNNGSRLYKFM